ncbi:MAG TPA: alcohol acetyltransferase, partial [Clostridia bacterium]|nr:alcohol acetyltransferase [Clostridia bacterium]
MKVKGKVPLYAYRTNIIKKFSKFIRINKAESKVAKNSLECIPADGQDIYNYVARYRIANFQTQAVMKLDGRLDFNKLSEAVRLSFDVEPVFGCRFIESIRPYWKR